MQLYGNKYCLYFVVLICIKICLNELSVETFTVAYIEL